MLIKLKFVVAGPTECPSGFKLGEPLEGGWHTPLPIGLDSNRHRREPVTTT